MCVELGLLSPKVLVSKPKFDFLTSPVIKSFIQERVHPTLCGRPTSKTWRSQRRPAPGALGNQVQPKTNIAKLLTKEFTVELLPQKEITDWTWVLEQEHRPV